MADIFRGGWIPATNRENCTLFRCPICGEIVCMQRGRATYPTCPFCLSDMPEAEDFETPEELEEMKRGNRAATGKSYSSSREDSEEFKRKCREYYVRNVEHIREYKREYRARNSEKIRAEKREYAKKHPEKNRECCRRYYQKHREQILAAAKKNYKADPEKYRERDRRYRGKSMREVTAHILGVPVEEVTEQYLWFGKREAQQ